MSIRSAFVITICGGAALAGTPAAAQDREDVVGPVLEEARRAYAAPEPERELPADCPESADNEIVVCAPVEQNPDQYRVQSRLERGDESHLEWTGQAPDVSGPHGVPMGRSITIGAALSISVALGIMLHHDDVVGVRSAILSRHQHHCSDCDR